MAGRLLKPAEAGERLGVSHDVVDRMIRDGRIPFVDVGTARKRRARIEESELEKWIADHRQAPVTPGA